MAAVLKIRKRQFVERVDRNALLRAIVKEGHASGRATIRRVHFRAATEGNVAMMSWLGKQYLASWTVSSIINRPQPGGGLIELTLAELLARIKVERERPLAAKKLTE